MKVDLLGADDSFHCTRCATRFKGPRGLRSAPEFQEVWICARCRQVFCPDCMIPGVASGLKVVCKNCEAERVLSP